MARNPKVTLPAYKMELITATLIFSVGAASFDLRGGTKKPHDPTPRGCQLLGDSSPFSVHLWRDRPPGPGPRKQTSHSKAPLAASL